MVNKYKKDFYTKNKYSEYTIMYDQVIDIFTFAGQDNFCFDSSV